MSDFATLLAARNHVRRSLETYEDANFQGRFNAEIDRLVDHLTELNQQIREAQKQAYETWLFEKAKRALRQEHAA